MGKEAAEIVKNYREEMGISQSQLAMYLRTSQSVISDIENGSKIGKRLAKKLAVLTEKDLEKFIDAGGN